MINLAGYITFPSELTCNETGAIFDSTKFFKSCESIISGHIACSKIHLHNAMYGMSLFDFSNHDSGIEAIIETLLGFIKKFDTDDVSLFIRLIDSERSRESNQLVPYEKMWVYGI